MSCPKKHLILTSSGGGGLLQTAMAQEQEILAAFPNAVIIRRDLLKDWAGKWFGGFCIQFWNGAQMQGSVRKQRFLQMSHLLLGEYLFWPLVFCCSLYTLFKEDVDRIIDTQPIGTAAMLKAIRIFNRWRKKTVHLEKVMVDMPTKKATHFFRPIRRLSKSDRKCLKLMTIAPLLEEGQTEGEFWRQHCRLPREQVFYEECYVREAFLKYKGKARAEGAMTIPMRYTTAQERQLLHRVLCKGAMRAEIVEGTAHFAVGADDLVLTVLLGSQPSNEATFSYVKQLVALAQRHPPTSCVHLFVFAAEQGSHALRLFRKIVDFVSHEPAIPKTFSVIPFSFQSDEAIAPLFYRSDLTLTRSGGGTLMELMCVNSGENWIHSSAKKGQNLLAGIPGWEAENAVYLQRLRGATIVTPETFSPLAAKFFGRANTEPMPQSSLESSA